MTAIALRATLDGPGPSLGEIATEHMLHAFARVLTGPGGDVGDGFVRLVTGQPHPFGNFVCFGSNAAEPFATEMVEPLLGCGAPAAVLFAGKALPGVVERLRAMGFADAGNMPAMGVEIARLPATALPEGYTFERVTGTDQRDAWGEVFARGYELPEPVGAAFTGGIGENPGHGPEGAVRYYWILKAGKPVATSMLMLGQGVAGVYAVATLAEERGRGLGAHATAQALREAGRVGYGVGVLQSSEMGYGVYQKLGFVDVGNVPLLVRVPG